MTYGEAISASERDGRPGLDLLARMIYAEAQGENEMGKRGVACVARNRKDHAKASEFGGTTYKDIILKENQFVSISTSDFLKPNLNSTAWKDSLNIALNMDTVVNPISACLWFNKQDTYQKRIITENGVEKYKFPGTDRYQQVTEKKVLGKHIFFRVSGY